jgi:hypothetical protein
MPGPKKPTQTVFDLRKIHHKHAAKVARQAKILLQAAECMLQMQKQIEQEAIAITGEDYKLDHSVGHDEHGLSKPSAVTSPPAQASWTSWIQLVRLRCTRRACRL